MTKVSGIECVGEVANDPSGFYTADQTIAAIMGGMGRTQNGSYAEYTCVPTANVIPLDTKMDWADLAAIPESYATAWISLHENLRLKGGDTVFIRGGTSALGQAAINIASNIDNVTVISSTRNSENIQLLRRIGCSEVLIETENLSDQLRERYPEDVDGVLDIIGNTTLLDSMKMVRKGGVVCNAGFLGGGDPILFNPLVDMPPSVSLNFFASFMFGTKDFPISDVPMQSIIDKASKGIYKTKPARVFEFGEIQDAHNLMEENTSYGKIVVSV